MRPAALALVLLAASGCSLSGTRPEAPAAAGLHAEPAGDAVRYRHDAVGLTVDLPPAFVFQGHLASPGFGLLHFVDEPGGRFFAVELHAYLTPSQRADWVALGGTSLDDAVRAFDPSQAATPVALDGVAPGASALRIEAPEWDSAVVQTCEQARCLRIRTTGPRGSLTGEVLRAFVAGVRLT